MPISTEEENKILVEYLPIPEEESLNSAFDVLFDAAFTNYQDNKKKHDPGK